ncbi:hypothetical protein FDO65_13100 [Nakamurella flava]|uniref:Uncharacterized protein n=1 Tax=Nakamurella flava TaxID=2576308 RepID=A0A4U6QER4_9ACTN|nr:hypothetical protein [Nakamurella flava]TKV58486.1 hypothetical protein FDO65_13100 [Nakamurella flava]
MNRSTASSTTGAASWIALTALVLAVLPACGAGRATSSTGTPSAEPAASSVAEPTPSTSSTTASPATAGTAALLASAQTQLSGMRQSDYQHETAVDAAAGRYDYDCSGFIDYTLTQVSPAALAEIPTTASAGRALAQDFEGFFSRLGAGDAHWTRVPTVPEIRPGDIVAWLVSPDTQSRDTGHVMIAATVPEPDPTISGAYRLQIIDSTTSPHADDSRTNGATGLGTGSIGLAVDAQGQPTGFYWQGGRKPDEATSIAVGRLTG